MISVFADSVLVMPRTPTVTLPYNTALPSANRAPSENVPAPGRATISTPAKPMRSAPQRAGVARSLSHRIDTSAANSGAEKLIDTALASGISVKASANNVCEVAWDSPRAR